MNELSEGFTITKEATSRDHDDLPNFFKGFSYGLAGTDVVINTPAGFQIRLDRKVVCERIPFKAFGFFTYKDYSNQPRGDATPPHRLHTDGKIYFTVNRGPSYPESPDYRPREVVQALHDGIDYYLWMVIGANYDQLVTCIDSEGVKQRLIDNPPIPNDRGINPPPVRDEAFYKATAESFLRNECACLLRRTGLTLEDQIALRNNLMGFLKNHDNRR
jgi:hypothetical protein